MEPTVTPVSDGVFHVEGAGTNWQILVEGSHVTLVDAAWPKDYELVAASLEEVGRLARQLGLGWARWPTLRARRRPVAGRRPHHPLGRQLGG